MRNFGNDFFATQQRYLPHHQFPPLTSVHQLAEPLSGSPASVKMEPHLLAKSVGVGTNLRHSHKTHFSPVSMVAHSHHHPSHYNNINGHHNSNNNNSTNNSTNNNPNGSIPINLSQGQTTAAATTSMISPMSAEPTAPPATILSHLPTVALAAACPTIRGPSPAHHQQSPINGLPYHHHSSHSPTLPVAHTALPSEIQSNTTPGMISNRSSPPSLPPPHINSTTSNSPYHHTQYQVSNFNQIQTLSNSNSTGATAEISQNHHHPRIDCSPNSSHHASASQTNTEVARTNLSSTHSDDSSASSRSNSVADSSTTSTRIVSQNVNGTYAITGIPSNKAELEVFRVMQRANLLSYFDKMIENGGDDVQQLCDAGKEEFLEIMALIGMAAKPLHVRRLQKALQEWMTQPSIFQSPVLPAGYQHHFGAAHIDRTISHTQFTATIAAATTSGSSASNGGVGHYPAQTHHPVPVIPIPHLISHNSILPYPAQNAPLYALEPPKNSCSSSTSSDTTYTTDNLPPNNDSTPNSKNLKSHERRSNNSSPSLSSNAAPATTIVGLDKVYLQRGSPSIPVVISTAQTPNPGQQGLSSCSSSSFTEHYQNCPSPSGSTSSNSSTVSIKSHHQFHHPSSPLESYPDSPVNSESGRSISNKQEESSTCTELENASSCSSDQTNSIQLLENSTGNGTLRVASRSSSYCGSIGGGSEPSSPAPPPPLPPSFSKGILISSSQQTSDSPRSSSESITNRNNSVAVTSTTSTQDFSSLQEHEIQKLAETALNIARSLPPHVKEPKLSKKIETSSYEFVRRLAEDDPRRMYEIRRLCTIFGKSGENGKRSKGNACSSSGSLSISPSNKTMSILELAMNEAAAQLCKLMPALLTKKDEMYSLAKQVIRESGLPYNVICANSNLPSSFLGNFASNSNNECVGTSGSSKGKIDHTRNSPAHEQRISNEFAAACKKIKLDIHGSDNTKEVNGHSFSRKSSSGNAEATLRIAEVHNPLRKSPSRENKGVTAISLKKISSGSSDHRKGSRSMECRRSQS